MSKWESKRITFIESLVKKELYFANCDSNWNIALSMVQEEYDFIIAYMAWENAYILCDAKLHKGKGSVSVKCLRQDKTTVKKIRVAYKQLKVHGLYERVFYIPENEIETFFKKKSYYLKSFQIDESKPLGKYDENANEIIPIEAKK